MKKTQWWTLYEQQVIGSAKAACQLHTDHSCYIFCVAGGPISRVESRNMKRIIENVDLPAIEGYETVVPKFEILRGTLDELQEFVTSGLSATAATMSVKAKAPAKDIVSAADQAKHREMLAMEAIAKEHEEKERALTEVASLRERLARLQTAQDGVIEESGPPL